MTNNRKQEGMELRLEVDYIANGTFYTGFARELSTEGLYITTTEIVSPGEVIFIDMYLPNYRHKLKLKGRVLRACEYPENDTPPGMAVEFLELKDNFKMVISEYLSSLTNENEIE